MLKVAKFGGSSMADAGQFKKVRGIVLSDSDRKVIVVSAPGKSSEFEHKITDLLYLCNAHIKYGVSCEDIFGMIRTRYEEIKTGLGLSCDLGTEFDKLWAKLQKGADKDYIVSRGEYFAALLMAEYLGYTFLDAALWLHFNFDGTVNQEASYEALVQAADGRNVVIPGFYGTMDDGKIVTFSRGGSDITGALAAAALDADVYENWTDVSGILMADPRIIERPESIKKLTYGELRQLSYLGAQVLHEQTVFPVREKNIPINIRNTNEPEHPGTMILNEIEGNTGEKQRLITGIAGKKGYASINFAKTGFSSEIGSIGKVLKILNRHRINIEYIPSGIDNASFVCSAEKLQPVLYQVLGEIQSELEPDNLSVTEHIAIVAAVGRNMVCRPGVSGKLFAKLGEHGVNIRVISQGPDELNIIVGIEEKDYEQAVKVLYDSFVKEEI